MGSQIVQIKKEKEKKNYINDMLDMYYKINDPNYHGIFLPTTHDGGGSVGSQSLVR